VISGSPFPFYFEPCATAEWEVLLDRDGVQLAQEAQETQEAQEALQSAARAARAARAASPPSRAKSSVNLSEITADLKLPEDTSLEQWEQCYNMLQPFLQRFCSKGASKR
jgi:hypothetical protein